MLEFCPGAYFALGAHMGDNDWRVVLTDLDAQVVERLDVPIPAPTPAANLEALVQGVAEIRQRVPARQLLPAIGLGTRGLVDIRSGVIQSAHEVGWLDVPFRQMVEEALELPALVVNRGKLGALAEVRHRAAEGVTDLVYLSLGAGIGCGIVHDGALYVGANSSAGELAHSTVAPDGPLCPCGNYGCLQALAAGPAIANRARAQLRHGEPSVLRARAGNHPEHITAQDVVAAADEGDALAGRVIGETAGYLGIAIANLVNILNPQRVVLAGPIGLASRLLLERVQQETAQRAMAYPLSAVRITRSALGLDGGAIGAAALVLQQAIDLIFR